jgi:hypothetical protein
VNAASLPEWLFAAGVGAALYVPGALLILSLDHDLTRTVTTPARALADAADRAVDRLLLVLVTPIALKEALR